MEIILLVLTLFQTLWAMPNLSNHIDGSNGASTPKSFYLSWIILPLGTYFAAAFFLLVAWAYSSPDAKDIGKQFALRARGYRIGHYSIGETMDVFPIRGKVQRHREYELHNLL